MEKESNLYSKKDFIVQDYSSIGNNKIKKDISYQHDSESEDNLNNLELDTTTYKTKQIENFLIWHTDDIVNLLFILNDQFKYSPSFLKYIDSIYLTDLFIHIIFKQNNWSIIPSDFLSDSNSCSYLLTKNKNKSFNKEYLNEIHISYNIINEFLKKFKKYITFDLWYNICYHTTDKYFL